MEINSLYDSVINFLYFDQYEPIYKNRNEFIDYILFFVCGMLPPMFGCLLGWLLNGLLRYRKSLSQLENQNGLILWVIFISSYFFIWQGSYFIGFFIGIILTPLSFGHYKSKKKAVLMRIQNAIFTLPSLLLSVFVFNHLNGWILAISVTFSMILLNTIFFHLIRQLPFFYSEENVQLSTNSELTFKKVFVNNSQIKNELISHQKTTSQTKTSPVHIKSKENIKIPNEQLISIDIKKELFDDFGLIMTKSISETGGFSLDRFYKSSVSLLNIYVNSKVIKENQKIYCAKYLVTEYNRGIGNSFTESEIIKISNDIIKDKTLDFILLRGII